VTATPDSPTIGAVRRAEGIDTWCDEARHMFAMAVAEEALRRAVLERLDSIMHFLAVGAAADQAVPRLAALLRDIKPGFRWLEREVAA
jgi:hypothetical protein